MKWPLPAASIVNVTPLSREESMSAPASQPAASSEATHNKAALEADVNGLCQFGRRLEKQEEVEEEEED